MNHLNVQLTCSTGEMPFVEDEDEIIRVVGENERELNMIFIFSLVDIDNIPGASRLTLHDWNAADLRNIVAKWQNVMRERGGWNSLFVENHVCAALMPGIPVLTICRINLDLYRDMPTTLMNTVSLVRNSLP